jgi:predicted permease
MGIPVVRGRAIDERDTASAAGVVMVNDTFARQFFKDEDPIGRRIVRGSVPLEVVGVAADVKQARLDQPTRPEIYHPITQATYGFLVVVVRTRADNPLALVPAVREQVAALDPDLPITRVATMEQVVSTSVRQPRLSSTLIGLFAALAALMATVGVYSVMSYSVTERTRELGIRIALGADARSVVRLVVGEGLTMAGVGIAVGALASLALTRVLGSQLYEVSPTDPLVFGATAAAVLAVAVAAALVPARRAMRVDPMVALRAE